MYSLNKRGVAGLGFLVGFMVVVGALIYFSPEPSTLNKEMATISSKVTRPKPQNQSQTNKETETVLDFKVDIDSGSASFAYNTSDEYIVIRNESNVPINLTGWKLKNSRANRPYDRGGNIVYYPSEEALIPKGTSYISPVGTSPLQNIILKEGEDAIVTTGNIGSRSPYLIVSFKENICSGYLNSMPEYSFTPRLSKKCPLPEQELGVANLPYECQAFIRNLNRCEIPKFNAKDENGDTCSNCVNGQMLQSSCVEFIKTHYNYASCIALHGLDSNFYLSTWRIFLGKRWEMWAENRETISLFDQIGRLINSLSY